MLFAETSRICDRVAHLLESYSPYNTAENEGWKVHYETHTLFGFCAADRIRCDCMYQRLVMQA